MEKQTLQEWTNEAKTLFGDSHTSWAFICPACGKVSTGQEFKEASAEPNDMYSTCIGRHSGKVTGCDWAAFGLIGTLGKGRIVVTEDGKEIEVFDFASNYKGEASK